MTAILVYSEQLDTALELLGAAQTLAPQLDLTVSAAVLGAEAAAQTAALAARGAAPVYLCTEPALEGLDTAVAAQALAHIAEQAGASLVLLGSTRRGRALAGRLAQRLGAGCVTDANSLAVEDGLLVAGRYNLGGATVQREALTSAAQVVAVMPKVFAADEAGGGGSAAAGAAAIVDVSPGLAAPAVRVVDRRPKEGETVDLAAAARIVGVGRGLAKRDDVTLGEGLAAALGAELACTKSLADFGWMSDDRIVGLSGAKTSPEVYLAVGISGQVQHTVGMAQARVVAVVNQDKDAPIFALADYGVIGDLYQIVPALIERLKTL
jgi:electron transfer flavoprotein alpha subunit